MNFNNTLQKKLLYFGILVSTLFHTVSTTTQDCDKKIIYYHDRTNDTNGNHVSLLPLIRNSTGGVVTNVLIATLDLNSTGLFLRSPDEYSINSPKFSALWSDMTEIQNHGIKVSAMMLGAFRTLSGNQTWFERNYAFLRDGLKKYHFDGLDIDAETEGAISLDEVIRLIDRLRKDFGEDFLITFSPVAEALSGGRNLSGFNYTRLEARRGKDIAWYNAQFYNSFGWVGTTKDYDSIIDYGFDPGKVVMGMATDPANAHNFAPLNETERTVKQLTQKYPRFKGVAGWVYFDARPGRQEKPWRWSQLMAQWTGLNNVEKE